MTHLLTGFMATVCLLSLGGKKRWKRLQTFSLGLGLAGVHLFPALTMMDLVDSQDWTDGEHLDWRRNFIITIVGSIRYGLDFDPYHWVIPGIVLLLGLASIAKPAPMSRAYWLLGPSRCSWQAGAPIHFGACCRPCR